jgi:hypothetical protein
MSCRRCLQRNVKLHELNQEVSKRVGADVVCQLVKESTICFYKDVLKCWLSLLHQQLSHDVEEVSARYREQNWLVNLGRTWFKLIQKRVVTRHFCSGASCKSTWHVVALTKEVELLLVFLDVFTASPDECKQQVEQLIVLREFRIRFNR